MIGTVVTAVAGVASLVRRVEVHGDSMRPTLVPGDRLLVVRGVGRHRPGQLVVVRDPRDPRRPLVKRVSAVEGDRVVVTGDNRSASTDSAVFGPVRVDARVVYRYHPAPRAGVLRWTPTGGRYDAEAMENPTEDLDRLLSAGYVDGLPDLSMDDVRGRRSECDELAGVLSYLRRLVQGRLDIVSADMRRREGGGDWGLKAMVDSLPEILSEGGRGGTTGRLPPEMTADVNHRLLTADLDRIIDVDTVGHINDLSDDEVATIATALVELEQSVSSRRRALHERMDIVQAEIVRRYKSGEATVDSLLP